MKKPLLIVTIVALFSHSGLGQESDSVFIRKIYSSALENGKAYEWLDFICHKIGNRLSGTENAAKAVGYTKAIIDQMGYAKTRLQPIEVPRWRRNDVEQMEMVVGSRREPLRMCSLGGSIGTPPNGVRGQVVEVHSFGELDSMDAKQVSGKIVFYNVSFDQKIINTFEAYSKVGKYRYSGAQHAAAKGAIASVTRSMATSVDDIPHTGSMAYNDTVPRIPACAISTLAANKLSETLSQKQNLVLEIKMNCDTLRDTVSYNVIAEIRGTEHPEEIVLLGAHLDSWDKGQGAHDDGAGCVQSMEVLRIFKELNYRPKRTIRIVLFMNEENGLRGGKQYAESAKVLGENHIAAIETDAGGFTPYGYSTECIDSTRIGYIGKWKPLFLPYGVHEFRPGGGGSDIGPLKDQGPLLIGMLPDSQRYFDLHHTEADTFDKVNRRELHLGAATLASLVYLLAEHGAK